MTFERLRAKSGPGTCPSEFLPGHLIDAFHAAGRVLAATADDQLRALGLSPERYRRRLERMVSVASAVHDLGKANDHFQGMIHGMRNVLQNPQGLRHEWVTLLMLEQMKDWLLPALDGSLQDFAVMEWAVAGHHPAVTHPSPPGNEPPAGASVTMTLFMGHDDYREALRGIVSSLGLTEPPVGTTTVRNLVGAESVFEELARWCREAQKTWMTFRLPAERRLVAAVKNCLVAADIAGSALPRAIPEDSVRWNWITDSFSAKPNSDDLQTIAQYRLKGAPPRSFQSAVAEAEGTITYVKAGCGTGKTIAAYLWAATNYPTRRLYFCYPTTGTATEGFRDYLHVPEEDMAADNDHPLACRIRELGAKLFHSRREVDLEIILGAANDLPHPELEVSAKLDSMEAWATPVVACTVDAVLGLIQNNRRGLYAWPALAQSAFVFDEIHAYDDRLFGALLRFLQDLPGLPVLLMTASLPRRREQALRSVMEDHGQPWSPICGPEELELRPRYRRGVSAKTPPMPTIRETLAAGGKVLWVCNTVGRVMDAASEARDLEPLVYHSRFKYEDRVARHQAVIRAFRQPGAVLAICSQVAEMSLDLSCDLLVTDLAPVPSLIQRLGRLHRWAKEGDPTKPFVVIELEQSLPYTENDMELARAWLARLPGENLAQRDLVQAWEEADDEPSTSVPSAWLDGGPWTTVKELRELSQGITVLMAEDRQRVMSRPKNLARWVLPMPSPPSSMRWQTWERIRGLPVAPTDSISYDCLRGATWKKS